MRTGARERAWRRTFGSTLVALVLAASSLGCAASPAATDAPPASVPCGAATCAPGEYCVIPCSGIDAGVPLPPPQCRPLPSGSCTPDDPCGCFCPGPGAADGCRIFYDDAAREIRCTCA